VHRENAADGVLAARDDRRHTGEGHDRDNADVVDIAGAQARGDLGAGHAIAARGHEAQIHALGRHPLVGERELGNLLGARDPFGKRGAESITRPASRAPCVTANVAAWMRSTDARMYTVGIRISTARKITSIVARPASQSSGSVVPTALWAGSSIGGCGPGRRRGRETARGWTSARSLQTNPDDPLTGRRTADIDGGPAGRAPGAVIRCSPWPNDR